MDIDHFLERAIGRDVEADPAEVRAVVERAESLTQAREEMRQYTWAQATADRIVQELVPEDHRINREEFAA